MNPKTVLIHEDFRNALNVSSLKPKELTFLDKNTHSHYDLEDMGFGNTITAKKAKTTKTMVDNVSRHNSIIARLQEVEVRFPQYRIISLSKIMSLLDKYNLYLGHTKSYIQEIPVKNIEEIKEYKNLVGSKYRVDYHGFLSMSTAHRYNCEYLIAAPKPFFEPGLTEVNRCLLKLEKAELKYRTPDMTSMFDTDPIVLRPLDIASGEIFFHIVTAWDLESTDEEVTKDIPKQIENN